MDLVWGWITAPSRHFYALFALLRIHLGCARLTPRALYSESSDLNPHFQKKQGDLTEPERGLSEGRVLVATGAVTEDKVKEQRQGHLAEWSLEIASGCECECVCAL